jgi:hypothetical protein
LSKINQILSQWPAQTLLTSDWLEKKGISRQLAASYVKSGWFERFDTGVYKRPQDEVTWAGALYTLQAISGLAVFIGGKTALEIQGYGHYVHAGFPGRVVLWKQPDLWLPAWFTKHTWDASIEVRSARLFDDGDLRITSRQVGGLTLHLSSPERAVLEYVYDIPKHESLDQAHYIMEGLATLRPALLQELLQRCRSIKVKRLFLHLAQTYNHSWFTYLDESSVELGSGKREIIKGGKLDKKYRIVVPDINREER